MSDPLDHIVEAIMDSTDDVLEDILICESEKDDILNALGGETTIMNYMMLFEELLEEHDIYLFDGWEEASFVGVPTIEKFWATFHLKVGEKTDLRGAKRIKDALDQCEIRAKKLDEGGIIIKFSVLKRTLDAIEQANQERIQELSDQALGED